MTLAIYKESQPKKESVFLKRPLVFIDIETTGLNPNRPDEHEILEIGCLVVDRESLKVLGEYCAKVVPERIESADPKALEVNHYSEDDWRGAKPLRQVIEELNDLAPGGLFIGWNVSFDRGFIEKAASQMRLPLNYDYHWLDVASMADFVLYPNSQEFSKPSLGAVCELLEIPHKEAHTALGDARATFTVYKALRKTKDIG
ncbi:exonuclease domain-containing protein [Patescibacteria group bacterium]